MVSSTLILIEMFKTGIIIAFIMGIVYLIFWSIKRNVKLLFNKLNNKDLVDWLLEGFKKNYKEEQLTSILIDRGFNVDKILKSLIRAKKIIKMEVLKNEQRRKRKLQSIEGEARENAKG